MGRKSYHGTLMAYGDYPDLSRVKKILVIKLRQLGDVLLTGPVFSSLKAHLPQAQIDAYVYSESTPLLRGHPAVHSLFSYDRAWKKGPLGTRLRKEVQLLRQIRAAGYDLVINLTEGDRGALAARFSGASIRVGFDPKKSGLWGKKNLYTHVAKNCPSLRHTVERNLDAIRRIGIFPSPEQRELFLQVDRSLVEAMRSLVGAPYTLIHPTSRWKFKCWPVEKMRALAWTLESSGRKLVFTAGPDAEEKEMVSEICKGTSALNLSGKISLSELTALIDSCEELICVDSLPFHMANALKKPVVAIFGPTSDVTWGAWRNPHARIVSQPFSCRPCYQDGCGGSKVSDCLTSISVEQVLAALHPAQTYSLKSSPK